MKKKTFMRVSGIVMFVGGSLFVGYQYLDLVLASGVILWGGYLFQKTEEE